MTEGSPQEEEVSPPDIPIKDNQEDKKEEGKEHLEEEARDDEGLLLKYDVIVCGTGLVQGIVASALVRAGKSVLHCDGAEIYGELDAVWNLEALGKDQVSIGSASCNGTKEKDNEKVEVHTSSDATATINTTSIPLSPKGGTTSLIWHEQKRRTSFGIGVGTAVRTPYGNGTVKEITNDNTKIAISLDNWKLADGKSPVAYFGIDCTDEEYLAKIHKIESLRTIQAQEILTKYQRYLALDATPSFILAAGRAVQGMLASNVADYLEFKSIDGLYWLEENGNEKDNKSVLSRVPCNKSDVFSTKLLKPMDKRRLMKFLQLSMDYATQMSAAEELMRMQARNNKTDGTNIAEEAETEVQSLNERHLNQGRSLARPQNKAVATEDLKILQKSMEEGVTFDDFLSTNHKLSPKLRALVRYALALETEESSSSLSFGMSSLRHHLQALGRFGSTAFLVPMYGSGELSQAFCRSAAVFGATYLLRRAPIGIQQLDNDNDIGVWIAADPSDEYGLGRASQKAKIIRCNQLVVPIDALPTTYTRVSGKRILRRIAILNGKLIESSESNNNNNEQRHVFFIPPKTIGNTHVIHCATLDSSTQVAPVGCTLLHMTTTIDENHENPTGLMEKALNFVITANQTKDPLDEVYSVTFSHKLHIMPDSISGCDANGSDAPTKNILPKGIHVCHHTGQVLTADVAFEQAQKIFSTICPGKEFLGLSDELDAKIRERAAERGYEDDERLMLESALGMIENTEAKEQSAALDESKVASP